MRGLADKLFPQGTSRRALFGEILRGPIAYPVSLLSSLIATFRLTGVFFPLRVRISPRQKFRISVHRTAKIRLCGVFSVAPWGGSNLPSSLTLGRGAHLNISGDFHIGPNVHIEVAENGKLAVAGVRKSTGSGITCDSRVKVEYDVKIGADSIIAWNVFISDSNWHDIDNTIRASPVSIGDEVWISHGVSILKGATVRDGCIVGAHCVVGLNDFPARSLVAGNPASVKREGVRWTR